MPIKRFKKSISARHCGVELQRSSLSVLAAASNYQCVFISYLLLVGPTADIKLLLWHQRVMKGLERLNNTCIHWISSTLVNTCRQCSDRVVLPRACAMYSLWRQCDCASPILRVHSIYAYAFSCRHYIKQTTAVTVLHKHKAPAVCWVSLWQWHDLQLVII